MVPYVIPTLKPKLPLRELTFLSTKATCLGRLPATGKGQALRWICQMMPSPNVKEPLTPVSVPIRCQYGSCRGELGSAPRCQMVPSTQEPRHLQTIPLRALTTHTADEPLREPTENACLWMVLPLHYSSRSKTVRVGTPT